MALFGLAAAAILASFIPVVMATAGNAGMQAAAVSLQDIAGAPEDASFAATLPERVLREVSGALLNGAILGAAVAMIVMLVSLLVPIAQPLWLGATVALSQCCVVLLASTIGTSHRRLLRLGEPSAGSVAASSLCGFHQTTSNAAVVTTPGTTPARASVLTGSGVMKIEKSKPL